MRLALVLCAICAGLFLLDRLLLWMERCGWIFYRRRKPDPASVGSALLQLHQMAQPDRKYMIEARQRERAEHEDTAGSDDIKTL